MPVYARPRVAILATGDEIVPVNETAAADFQIRNSNAYSLAVQVARAGGMPEILPSRATSTKTRAAWSSAAWRRDLLLLSGGVSAGKYDIVERVLADFGAEFFFDRVLIQPGQPLVFGRARDKFFFGLPGNPASTMVTFELFARAAVELLGGQEEARSADAVCAADAGIPPQDGLDALSAGAPERGRRRGHAGALARLGRRAGRWRAPTPFWWPSADRARMERRRDLIRVLLK